MKSSYIHRFFVYCLLFSQLLGCGADEEQKIDDAVEIALTFLTNGDCQGAIDTLEDVGRQPKHYLFVKTLAASYACRGGYSTPHFFGNDIAKVGASASIILRGFGQFTSSDEMDAPDNPGYEDIQEAIDVLLYAGGIGNSQNPTSLRRDSYFGTSEASNINILLLYLTMVQLGKYVYFYGDSDSTGIKGAGGTYDCFLDYRDTDTTGSISLVGGSATVDAYLTANGGACAGSSDLGGSGNPYLGTEGNLNVARMCQGVILLNTFFNTLVAVVDQLAGDDFSDFDGMQSVVDTLNTAIVTAYPGAVDAVRTQNQSSCVSLFSGNTDPLEVYFAFYFEGLFQ